MIRRMFFAAGLAVALLGHAALAASQGAYTQATFDAARNAGKPILVAVHAPWCPVCKKQGPIIDKLAATPDFKDLVILIVDYDSQKDVVSAMGVQKQSTLIVLHGKDERGRSVGVTDEADIKALMQKANG